MMEELITISEDSPTDRSIVPENNGTIPYIKYDVLISNPYKYSEREFFQEVHFVRRRKKHLQIENYNLKRMHLLKKYGWGVHIDLNKKIAIIPCESQRYKELLNDKSVRKSRAYRNNRIV
jgi:hypothetical protein